MSLVCGLASQPIQFFLDLAIQPEVLLELFQLIRLVCIAGIVLLLFLFLVLVLLTLTSLKLEVLEDLYLIGKDDALR